MGRFGRWKRSGLLPLRCRFAACGQSRRPAGMPTVIFSSAYPSPCHSDLTCRGTWVGRTGRLLPSRTSQEMICSMGAMGEGGPLVYGFRAAFWHRHKLLAPASAVGCGRGIVFCCINFFEGSHHEIAVLSSGTVVFPFPASAHHGLFGGQLEVSHHSQT